MLNQYNERKMKKRSTSLTPVSASIQLNAHGNVAVPRLGMNTYKAGFDWWNYLESNCVIDVIVSTENLKGEKRKFVKRVILHSFEGWRRGRGGFKSTVRMLFKGRAKLESRPQLFKERTILSTG